MSGTTKLGHGLAKALGIKIQYRDDNPFPVTRGESAYSIDTADTYVEQEPTTWDWITETAPSGRQILRYFYNLFPFVHWIGRYNLQWLAGDLIAGKFTGLLTGSDAHFPRCYRGLRCCSSKHGIRQTGRASGGIWTVQLVHGCINLLVLRNF